MCRASTAAISAPSGAPSATAKVVPPTTTEIASARCSGPASETAVACAVAANNPLAMPMTIWASSSVVNDTLVAAIALPATKVSIAAVSTRRLSAAPASAESSGAPMA